MGHVMVDIEALGSDPGSVILSVGAVRFCADGVDRVAPFYRSIDIFSSLLAGLTVDYETVGWWRGQDAEAIIAAQPRNGKVLLNQALDAFSAFMENDDRIWAKGPDYDLVLLGCAYRAVGMKPPWRYRNARDVRTVMALSGVKHEKARLKHSAVDDAIAQAETVIAAHVAMGLELEGE